MRLFNSISIGLLVGLIVTSSYAISNASQSLSYKNHRGSILTLHFDSVKNNTGNVTGSFITAVGNCRADMGIPMPVTGYFNENAIALSINFPECKQVINMTGYLTADKQHLQVTWLDATVVASPHDTDWNAMNIGTDSFKKTLS